MPGSKLGALPSKTGYGEIGRVFLLGLATATRVVVLVPLTSLVWVPVGVWIGLRPRLAQHLQSVALFLAAFSANLLFPLAVSLIVTVNRTCFASCWLSASARHAGADRGGARRDQPAGQRRQR